MSAEISDGFGSTWGKCARVDCGLEVVRPGKVQCWCDAAGGPFWLASDDPYADPDFTAGMVVAGLDGGPNDRHTWAVWDCDDPEPWFLPLWIDAERYFEDEYLVRRDDLPARLGVVDDVHVVRRVVDRIPGPPRQEG